MREYEKTDIRDYFRLIQDKMQKQKEMFWKMIEKKQSYPRGFLFEEIVRDTLRELLPSRFGIAHGFLIEAEGPKSKQCDIIIYDSALYSPLLNVGSFAILPALSALAVIEVKTTINGTNLKEAFENFKAAKRLLPIGWTEGYLKGYIFALDSCLGKEAVCGIPKDNVSGIYVLKRGFLRGGKMYQSKDTLLHFICSLSEHLTQGMSYCPVNIYENILRSLVDSAE